MTVSSNACPSAPAGGSTCSSSRRGQNGSSSGCRYVGGCLHFIFSARHKVRLETCLPDGRISFHSQLVLTKQTCRGASGFPGWPFRGCVCQRQGWGVEGELPESRHRGWALSAFQGMESPGRQTSDFQARPWLSASRASGLWSACFPVPMTGHEDPRAEARATMCSPQGSVLSRLL